MRWGLTVDDIDRLDGPCLFAIQSLCRRPTIRVVIDDGRPLTDYSGPVRRLAEVGDVMVQVSDSFSDQALTFIEFCQKMEALMDMFRDVVRLWEVGNEVNGIGWVGLDMYRKTRAGIEACRRDGFTSAVTWFLDDTLPEALKATNDLHPDIALISCYPENQGHMEAMVLGMPQLERDMLRATGAKEWGIGEYGEDEWEPKKKPVHAIIEAFEAFSGLGYWNFQKRAGSVRKPTWNVIDQMWGERE